MSHRWGLQGAFVTGGGYKYCQLGEGNCFLRVPDGCSLRPILTGWFAEFESIESTGRERVTFGEGAAAFAGATYDPTSHYRAAAVFAFHQQQGLAPDELRRISQRQVGLLIAAFEQLDVPASIARVEPMALERRGGFVAGPHGAGARVGPASARARCVRRRTRRRPCGWDRRRICATIS
jgi:kynureninase